MTRRGRRLVLSAGLALAGCTESPVLAIIDTAGGAQMVLVPAGQFEMGSTDGDADEAPVHRVSVGAFLIDRHEVTQAMFAQLHLPNPSRVKGERHPVDNVTWVDAARFCNARSTAEGLEPCYDEATARCDVTRSGYRLPTEAEWEYACRAGSTGDYAFGSDPRRLREFGWYADNAGGETHPVGSKKANAWGIHDLHGNVAEWCNDPYDERYYDHSPATDPPGPDDGEMFVVRGGSWASSPAALRSAARGRDRPGFGDACLAPDTLGLRCVRRVPATRLPE